MGGRGKFNQRGKEMRKNGDCCGNGKKRRDFWKAFVASLGSKK